MNSHMLHHWLDHFLKSLQVLLHTVVRPQKGDKVARVHSIEAMKESIHTGVEMDKVDFCHVAWFLEAPRRKTAKNVKEVVKVLLP